MFFDFNWDVNKARGNLRKHEVTFQLATSVFRDPLAVTIYDTEHSDDEERWVTLGRAQDGQVLVVVHTSEEVSATELHIRIISARRAEREEVRDYESDTALAAKGDAMKDQYDFSKGERGKFYRADATFRLPVYLDEKVQNYLIAKADAKGIDLADLVNDMLKKDIELIEMAR